MGEVKGLDFPNVIVYPTENMLTWINNTTKQLADETRAKLYVAVTRAEITIGIIVPDDFCLPSESMLQFIEVPLNECDNGNRTNLATEIHFSPRRKISVGHRRP